MSAFAVAMAAMWIAAPPPQAEGSQVRTSADGVPIRRERVETSPQTIVSFEESIQPAMDKYSHCLNEQLRHVEPTSAEAIAATSIAACAEVRTSSMREADALLKAKENWPVERRRQSIESTFGQLDTRHREYVATFLKLAVGTGQSSGPIDLSARRTGKTVRIETPKAVTDYRLCLMLRDGLVPTKKPSAPLPKVKAGGDCTPYRNQAVAEFDTVMRATPAPEAIRRTIIEQAIASVEAKHAQAVADARSQQKAR